MKKINYVFALIAVCAVLITWSCGDKEEEVVEACEPVEFCVSKTVTTCCADGVCHYSYNDKTYEATDAGRALLSVDLGCASKKSATYEADLLAIQAELLAIMNRVNGR